MAKQKTDCWKPAKTVSFNLPPDVVMTIDHVARQDAKAEGWSVNRSRALTKIVREYQRGTQQGVVK